VGGNENWPTASVFDLREVNRSSPGGGEEHSVLLTREHGTWNTLKGESLPGVQNKSVNMLRMRGSTVGDTLRG